MRVAARRKRQVDGRDERRALEGLDQHLDGLDRHAVLCFDRGRSEMRGAEHLRVPHEGEVLGRLHREDVEGRATQVARVERGDERRLVHERTARAVHENRALFHRGQLRGADEVFGLRAARRMQRHDVGLREQLVQRDRRHAQLLGALRRHERVEREERDPPRAQARGHARADLAEADQPNGFSLKFRSDELRALPFPGLQRSLCLGDLAQEREKDGDRMLRRGDDVPGRSVDDEDPALGSGLDVDVVEADARAPDDAELLSGGEELAVHLRRGPHDEGVIAADRREERLAGKVGAHVRGEPRLREDGEAGLGERFGDEDAIRRHAGLPAFFRIASMASSCAFR